MIKILIALLAIPGLGFSQLKVIETDTTVTGIIDMQGKVLNFKAKLTGPVILRNAIIEANMYLHIFDTSVTLQNCKADKFSTAWYGAKETNADNWAQLQKAANTCIANGIYQLDVVGSYTYSKEWTFTNVYNGNYTGFSLHLKGNSNVWSNRTQLTYTGNYYAIGIQYAKGLIIEGLAIKGNYIPPVNSGIAYYNTAFQVKGYHAGIMIDYASDRNQGGSTGVRISDCWIDGFDVCYDISPNGFTFNADIIRLENIRVGNCRVGIRGGQAQEKGNEIINVVAWEKCQILFQLGRSGKYQAGSYIIRGGNIAGEVVQLFDVSLSGWNSLRVYGLDAESIARIGTIQAWTTEHMMPVILEGLNIRFGLIEQCGPQQLINANTNRVIVSNSNLMYYGRQGLAMNFAGKATFINVNTGLNTWSNPNILHINFDNAAFNLKHTQ